MRRTRTTIEKREVVVIRVYRKPKRVFCSECPEPVALLTLDQAMTVSALKSRAVYRLIEEGQIHFVETPAGGGLICPATLLHRVWKEQVK